MIERLNALSKKEMIRVVILISGSGSTMERLLQECQPGNRLFPHIGIVGVIASKEQAAGINKARQFLDAADVVVIRRKAFDSAQAFGQAIVDFCRARQADMIGQHGWIPLTPDIVFETFPTINQHPAPLRPHGVHFGGTNGMHGTNAHRARLAFARAVNRDWWTEATVHCVTPVVDGGAIIMARQVPMKEDDTPERLSERVLPLEWDANVEVYEQIMRGQVAEVTNLPPLTYTLAEEQLLAKIKIQAVTEGAPG